MLDGVDKNVYRYAADEEALDMGLKYFPENQGETRQKNIRLNKMKPGVCNSRAGLPTSFFPYTGGNYHAPLVAIQVILTGCFKFLGLVDFKHLCILSTLGF